MKKSKLEGATVEELIELFVRLCIAQSGELLRGDVSAINRLFDEIEAVKQELKLRPGDQRHALTRLYDHENVQVRLKAAKATLAVAPEAARRALEDIKASNEQPQSGEAGSSLWNLERGIFKPT